MNKAIAIAAVLLIFVLLGWYEVSVWGECLEKNSWWYCLRILGK